MNAMDKIAVKMMDDIYEYCDDLSIELGYRRNCRTKMGRWLNDIEIKIRKWINRRKKR